MDRWRQIEALFHDALQHDSAERDVWLREACQGDADLRREVASLLANHKEPSKDASWPAAAAAQLMNRCISLQAGQRLGPYEIVAPIGAGGMGEVYRARDPRMGREVAIKISAERFGDRFEREVRAVAALNHANVCQIYDVGPNYLVMEVVEGPTLAVRMMEGALPLEEALRIARQIGDALEAAHEKGIIHRDLKPSNIKIKPDGTVKVLDFGLAKTAEQAVAAGGPDGSPTVTMGVTIAGQILGTAAYMSPEQARGAAVDKRSDIWSFGCVLYEMLTGKQAFGAETTSDILAAVLKEEPDWSPIPARVQPLLRRCLAKDPKRRLRDIGDATALFEGAPERATIRPPWVWIAVAAVFAIVAAIGWWRATRSAAPHPLVHLNAELPPATTINRFRYGSQLAISPDGARIVAILRDENKYYLATRALNQSEFAPLPGSEGAMTPFFSPDGQWIGFIAYGKLKKVAIQGGSPITLCDVPTRSSASWGDDNNIVVVNAEGGLSRVPSGGGSPTTVAELPREKDPVTFPQVLPGSQTVLFTVSRGTTFDDASVDALSFKTGQRTTVLRGGFWGRYLPSGHLVYVHQNTLFAAPFDLGRLAVTGAAQPFLADVANVNRGGYANLDFSQNGTLVYASETVGFPDMWLFWLDSTGATQPLHSTPGAYRSPRFSPDGKRLAFGTIAGPGRLDLWVKDLERDTTSRLTWLAGENNYPVWTPDGNNIVFISSDPSAPGMYCIRTDGSREPQRLTDGKTFPLPIPRSFSPDGRLAYHQLGADGYWEIWTVPFQGGDHPKLGKAERFLRADSPSLGFPAPAFSPDGRWLAYSSSETGKSEVYVRPSVGPASKSPVSTGGGTYPVWSPNGRELFYLGLDRRIMVTGYTAKGDSFMPGKPRVWSQKRLVAVVGHPYDLATDGKHFAVLLYPGATAEQEQKPIDSVTVLLNFFDELRRRVPTGGK